MLERELVEIVADPTDDGTRINRLADEFRRGRDLAELAALLNSDNAQLVSIAAWILGELSFDLYCSEVVIGRLRRLIGHADPAVRFHALGALFPALDPIAPGTGDLLRRLLSDPNEGVRRSAEAAASRLNVSRQPRRT